MASIPESAAALHGGPKSPAEAAVSHLHPDARRSSYVLFAALTAFCERSGFSDAQTQLAIDLLLELVEADLKGSGRPVTASNDHFQAALLKHAVQRPPHCTGTFLPSEAVALYDFVVKLYYRHYRLVCYCLGSVPDLQLAQGSIGGNDEPPAALPPLSEAVLLGPIASGPGGGTGAFGGAGSASAATLAAGR